MSEQEKIELEISINNEALVKKLTNIKIKNFWGGIIFITIWLAGGIWYLSGQVSDWRNWRQSTNTNISELKDWKNRVEIANEYHITSKRK